VIDTVNHCLTGMKLVFHWHESEGDRISWGWWKESACWFHRQDGSCIEM